MENNIIKCMLDLGEAMLFAGAEIHRIEDTLLRVGTSFGLKRVDVFVLTSTVNLTVTYESDICETQTRRIVKGSSTNFDMLEELNSLCRNCANMSIREFDEKLKEITAVKARKTKICFGSILAAFAFALFFGGNIVDACVAGVFAVAIYLMQEYFATVSPNKVLCYFVTALFAGVGIYSFKLLLPALNVDKVIIGDIMLIIPGVAITNSVRDIVIGDTISGIIKFSESILWAIALAGGFMLSMVIMGGVV